jgi:non-homologous end joining protein Ku
LGDGLGRIRFRTDQLQPDQPEYWSCIKYTRVDAETGEEVPNEDISKGFKVDTDTYVEVTKEEFENVALESTRTIEIDEFVQREEIALATSSARITFIRTARSGTTPSR